MTKRERRQKRDEMRTIAAMLVAADAARLGPDALEARERAEERAKQKIAKAAAAHQERPPWVKVRREKPVRNQPVRKGRRRKK